MDERSALIYGIHSPLISRAMMSSSREGDQLMNRQLVNQNQIAASG